MRLLNGQTKLILIGILCLSFHLQSFAQLRQQYILNKNWEFRSSKEGKNTEWETVNVPHTWNAQDGITPEYYRGTGEYRYHLDIQPEMQLKNKRTFLRFEAVSQVAKVLLNSMEVGTHKGSFNAFCFEITPLLKKGDNLLEVKVSNSPDKHIAPLAGDFTIFGGIYRPVSLLVLPETCITPLDYASSGVYIHQDKINDQQAELSIVTKVNNSKTEKKLVVRASIFNERGEKIKSSTTHLKTGKETTTKFVNQLSVEHPVLWDGRSNPHMYRILIEILKGSTIVDSLSQYTGLRYFSVDSQKGFFLNGKPYKIKGVNRHQDREDKGWAINNADHREDMELIKEIGATGIRLAHYPHAEYFYNLCDKEGMLVWAEIPLVGKATPDRTFASNIRLQLTELIRQKFNHPSIFCWSLFNELSEGDVKDLIGELNDLAHAEDPGRLTVAAANIENRPENKITDIMAYNTYPGWYWAQPSVMKSSVADWNRLVGSKGIGVSEYGAGANVCHHQQDVKSAPQTEGIFHPEEWQSIVHEQNYQGISSSDFVWGSFVWNMFDFASASRNEGDLLGRNDKGLITYNRKIKKDAFYFYQSVWSDSPVLHITSQRDIARRDSVTDIKVYSNCDNLRLTVNEQEIENPKRENNIYIWPKVFLKKGENRIEVTGNKGQTTLTDQCKWILL